MNNILFIFEQLYTFIILTYIIDDFFLLYFIEYIGYYIINLFIYPSKYFPSWNPLFLSSSLPACLTVTLSLSLFLCLSVYLPAFLSLCMYLCLDLCINLFLYFSHFFFCITGSGKEWLEAAFAERMKARFCVATSSGTTALLTTLGGLGIGPGDEDEE